MEEGCTSSKSWGWGWSGGCTLAVPRLACLASDSSDRDQLHSLRHPPHLGSMDCYMSCDQAAAWAAWYNYSKQIYLRYGSIDLPQ